MTTKLSFRSLSLREGQVAELEDFEAVYEIKSSGKGTVGGEILYLTILKQEPMDEL